MNNLKCVYLAGPILGCTDPEARDWRQDVDRKLSLSSDRQGIVDPSLIGISPLRCEKLRSDRYDGGESTGPLWTGKAILTKNVFDVKNCDAVIAYLPIPEDGRHQSYGTIMEIAWAFLLDKPTVLVSDDPKIINHPIIAASCAWVLNDLDQAVEVISSILLGYTGTDNV